MRLRKRIFGGAGWLILAALLLLMVLPAVLLVSYSLMGGREILDTCGAALAGQDGQAQFRIFPLYPTLASYVCLLFESPEYFTAFWNSVLITAGVLLGQLLIAVPAAWAFARYRFKGKTALRFIYMLLMVLPFQVTMVSTYLVLDTLHLLDTYFAVILPGVFSTLPVFILQKSFASIPQEIIEAARMDGAGEARIFFEIGLPLGKPGIFSVLMIGFLEYWNAIEQPMTYLKTDALKPLAQYLPDLISGKLTTAFAASVVTLLPPVLLFYFGQENLEQGIAASAGK